MIFANRYTVECQEMILQEYEHVDFEAINKITRPLYSELRKALAAHAKSEDANTYRLDDMMVALATLVHRVGYEMDKDKTNQNTWVKDAFPEFCSLIGPNSGFAAANETPVAR